MTTAREQKREYWRNHIEAWRQSGLSQKRYCEQAQISLHSFCWWHGRGLKSKPKKPGLKTMSFVPVFTKESKPQIETQHELALILPNQTKLLLPSNMANNDLINLVKVLGGLS